MLRIEAVLATAAFSLEAALEVGDAECVALAGPNGSGKSTLLAITAGLLHADRARIELGGECLCDTARGVDLPPWRRRLGLVFQDYALFPHLSVAANVAYGARGDAAATRDAMARLGVAGLAARAPGTLSGGERQRVALARALASGARALLLDEPFGALDPAARGALRHELRALLRALGLPALIVTHDPLEARIFGDRVAVLERGRLTQSGSWEDLAGAPRSAFVAELAGLNFYVARIESGRGLKRAMVGSAELHVVADEIEGEAYLAVAPAEVTLSGEAPHGSARNLLAGPVRELVPMGSLTRVRIAAEVPITAEITREAAEALALAPGVRVWASIKATAIRVIA